MRGLVGQRFYLDGFAQETGVIANGHISVFQENEDCPRYFAGGWQESRMTRCGSSGVTIAW
jgi:hypothetical protein